MANPFFFAAGVKYDVSLRPVDKALAVRRRALAPEAAPSVARRVASVDVEKLQRAIRESPVLASRVSDVTAMAIAGVVPRVRRAARAGATPPAAPRVAR